MNASVLEEIGLTQREIAVYTALIELGSSTVGPIAKHTGLQAGKIYATINKLQDKGLASYTIVSKTKHFQASDPNELIHLLEEKKRAIQPIVEELKEKQEYNRKIQKAAVHEGFKAFKALFNRLADELEKGDVYRAFAFKDEYNSTETNIFLRNFHRKLADKKVRDYAIAHTSVQETVRKAYEDNKNISVRYTDNQTPLGVIIVKNKIINLVWGERPTAIEITSEQIYEQYERFFNEIWENASPAKRI